MSFQSEKRRVVITGFGMITPLGNSAQETFEKACRGLSGIKNIQSFETEGLPCRIGGEIDSSKIPETPRGRKRLAKFTSRGAHLIKSAVQEAYAQAGLDEVHDRTSIGFSIGNHGENSTVEDIKFFHQFHDEQGRWDLTGLIQTGGYSFFNFFKQKPDITTALLSTVFNCTGPSYSVTSACAAGTQAIGEAYLSVREGGAPVMIAGGGDAMLNFLGLVGFSLLRALSEKYDSPETASRPFDRKRNGFVLSEGAGIVILENLQHARRRKRKIWGEILGYGASADAYRITDIHPEGEGAVLSMQEALEDARLNPCDIGYINAHGTSTIQNDETETLAIKKIFGKYSHNVPVSSNKSMLGHTIAGSGAIECILTLLGINSSTLLPTINYNYPDPRCDLDYVPNTRRVQKHQKALSNSFGFGGQNACLCLGSYED